MLLKNLLEPSSPLPWWCHLYTIPKGNANILQVCESGIRQKHLQTANHNTLCYIIKVLITDYQLYNWKNQNLDFNETVK